MKGEEILANLKVRPHWHVVIRPTEHQAERIPALSECWGLIDTSAVLLRGWDYPHVSPRIEERGKGNDWIASWSDFQRHLEYWRLYQSGQFVHLFAFSEDTDEGADRRARSDIDFPDGFQPSGYLSIVNVVYTITEIFEFAARLAQKGFPGQSVSVEIEMRNVKDRVLFAREITRGWWGFFAAEQETIGKKWEVPVEVLMSDSAGLARSAVRWFFERFGWMDPPDQLVIGDQRKLLERRL